MEATQVNVSNGFEDGAVSVGRGDQSIEVSAAVAPNAAPCFEFSPHMKSFENKKQANPGDQHLPDSSVHPGISCDPRVQVPTSVPGVSNCYVFKSRLQEYAQKVGLPTPVYETIKEGPSHEPSFRSTVIVGGARYESLHGFFNRKAAEQSAAEVALMDLSKSGDKKDSIAVPVHETGLCKNLLQEYAQKMNYAIPTYICQKDDTPGRTPLFSCTVEIGAIQYIGAAARTKKEAEIKAARTALLAIRSSGTAGAQNLDGKPQYTVVPGKRKVPETVPLQVETVKVKKPKKSRFKKKLLNRKQPCDSGHQSQAGIVDVLVSSDNCTPTATQQFENGLSDVQEPNHEEKPNSLASSDQDNVLMKNNQLVLKGALCPQVGVVDSSQTQVIASSSQANGHGNTHFAGSALPSADVGRNHDVDIIPITKVPPSVRSNEENNDQGVGRVFPVINAPLPRQLDALPTNPGIGHEDPATAESDGNHVGVKNNACTNV